MKVHPAVLAWAFLCQSLIADGLPVFTVQPTNQLRAPGTTVTFTCSATGADSLQWRQNGVDIAGATNATLTISNAQTSHRGYYVAIARNTAGWVPSQMAYLNVTSGGGIVPFSNVANGGYAPRVKYPYEVGGIQSWDTLVTNGVAQLMAGPELDLLQTVQDAWWDFTWNDPWDRGLFDDANYAVQSVAPTQTVYYQIRVTYPQTPGFVQYSTTLKLIAGGGAQPAPSSDGLQFYTWPEWPSPMFFNNFNPPAATPYNSNSPWMELRVASETTALKVRFSDWAGTIQWRKDGSPIAGATNFTAQPGPWGYYAPQLVITNTRPEDAGVYDLVINDGFSQGISPRISVSVQTQNGVGIFQSPRQSGSQFLADFIGAAGRNYMVECSTNLVNWTNLLTLTNTTGTLVFSNSIPPDGNLFYRSRLLP